MAILTLSSNVLVAQPYTLRFATQPSDVGRGEVISPAVVVEVLEDGAVAPGFTGDVTVELVGAGTLGGTLTVAAVAGVATFDDLTVDTAGTFQLRVTNVDADSVDSGAFDVTRPLALAFRSAPVVVEGEPFAVEVEVQDAGDGSLIPDAEIAVALGVASGPGVLLGDTSLQSVAGVATFSDLVVDSAGTYTLEATSSEAAPATSESIDASPGMVAILAELAADGGLFVYFALPIDTLYAAATTPSSYAVVGDEGAAAVASVAITGLRSVALTFVNAPPVGASTVTIGADTVRSTTGALVNETVLSFEGIESRAEPEPPPPEQETEPTYSAEAYARMLKDLLPRGAAWLLEPGSWISRVMIAVGDELARIDGRARDLLREQDPRTAVETLPEWESTLGLPDGCLTAIPSETSERQIAAAQRLISRGGQSRAFFVELAAALGYEGATIDEFHSAQLRAGFRVGARCYGASWAYAWRMNLPSGGPSYEQIDVECVIRRAAPAHTTVLFAYT